AASLAPRLPLIAGGRSFGGRMTSLAASQAPLPGVKALVFFGFPLHPAGAPATDRAEHLKQVTVPMLFLQGANDALATLDLLTPVVKRLGKRATLHVVDHADHSFHVPKRSGTTDEQVLETLARIVRDFAAVLR
ncbi:MAG TPA: alpha/beta family hydrolase, partial [Chloroflexota bacterium]|nr:alpha/beta family hydrolase [Chloroflexota bacterium]